ncbi:N-terminal Xaa-Pro-Lys N-methyltransferase 1-like isoform X2 [Amphibalanus amphitrite]|uniref:N-terminal Xaa-Pro-Lys N-methyltransferase 1-like isoform X2 n=1 Tax=Amphibalanus amphitrite TaxID=1232801 RepID=UPI001C9071EA|nr:N-terminal Xaa-Pro-Lys N-methyltransferase 1-like isoform X2 [Amphibalanus amphitrite]
MNNSTAPTMSQLSEEISCISCTESSQDSAMPATSEGSDGETPSSPDPNSLISYSKAASYWDGVPASVNGMLGGLGQVSSLDIRTSDELLTAIWKRPNAPGRERALDCGAGIGRITRLLLSRRFQTVDAVEQCAKFVEAARTALADNPHVGEIYCAGLQEFTPQPDFYDVIWCQWVLGHLTDDDLVQFFTRCARGLRPNGVIIVKENLASGSEPEYDATDSSVTRPRALLEAIFERAGLSISSTRKQNGMPRGLYEVRMFVLRPVEVAVDSSS